MTRTRRRGSPSTRAQGKLAPASAGPECQQQFLPNSFVDLIKVQRRLAFVAQQFLDVRPPFFRHLHSVSDVDDVHLKRLHQKILVVPTAGTGQRHACLLFRRQSSLSKT
jgi:hypothetical protein